MRSCDLNSSNFFERFCRSRSIVLYHNFIVQQNWNKDAQNATANEAVDGEQFAETNDDENGVLDNAVANEAELLT